MRINSEHSYSPYIEKEFFIEGESWKKLKTEKDFFEDAKKYLVMEDAPIAIDQMSGLLKKIQKFKTENFKGIARPLIAENKIKIKDEGGEKDAVLISHGYLTGLKKDIETIQRVVYEDNSLNQNKKNKLIKKCQNMLEKIEIELSDYSNNLITNLDKTKSQEINSIEDAELLLQEMVLKDVDLNSSSLKEKINHAVKLIIDSGIKSSNDFFIKYKDLDLKAEKKQIIIDIFKENESKREKGIKLKNIELEKINDADAELLFAQFKFHEGVTSWEGMEEKLEKIIHLLSNKNGLDRVKSDFEKQKTELHLDDKKIEMVEDVFSKIEKDIKFRPIGETDFSEKKVVEVVENSDGEDEESEEGADNDLDKGDEVKLVDELIDELSDSEKEMREILEDENLFNEEKKEFKYEEGGKIIKGVLKKIIKEKKELRYIEVIKWFDSKTPQWQIKLVEELVDVVFMRMGAGEQLKEALEVGISTNNEKEIKAMLRTITYNEDDINDALDVVRDSFNDEMNESEIELIHKWFKEIEQEKKNKKTAEILSKITSGLSIESFIDKKNIKEIGINEINKENAEDLLKQFYEEIEDEEVEGVKEKIKKVVFVLLDKCINDKDIEMNEAKKIILKKTSTKVKSEKILASIKAYEDQKTEEEYRSGASVIESASENPKITFEPDLTKEVKGKEEIKKIADLINVIKENKQKKIDSNKDEEEKGKGFKEIIDLKEEAILSLKAKIEKITSNTTIKNRELEKLKKQISELESNKLKEKEELKEKIKNGNDEIDELNEKMEAFKLELNKANEEKADLTKENISLKGELERAKKTKDEIESEKVSLESNVESLEKEIGVLESEKESLEKNKNSNSEDETKIKELNNNIKILRESMEVKDKKIESLNETINDLNKKIENLNSKVDGSNEEILALENLIEAKDEEIEELNREIEKLGENNEKLINLNKDLENKTNELKQLFELKEKEFEKLIKDVREESSNYILALKQELRTSKEELKIKIKKLGDVVKFEEWYEDEVEKKREEIEKNKKLKREIENLEKTTKELRVFEEKNNSLERELSKLKARNEYLLENIDELETKAKEADDVSYEFIEENDELKNKIEDLQKDEENLKGKLRQKGEELSSLSEKNQKKVEELVEKINNLNNKLREKIDKQKEEIEKIKENHKEQLETLFSAHIEDDGYDELAIKYAELLKQIRENESQLGKNEKTIKEYKKKEDENRENQENKEKENKKRIEKAKNWQELYNAVEYVCPVQWRKERNLSELKKDFFDVYKREGRISQLGYSKKHLYFDEIKEKMLELGKDKVKTEWQTKPNRREIYTNKDGKFEASRYLDVGEIVKKYLNLIAFHNKDVEFLNGYKTLGFNLELVENIDRIEKDNYRIQSILDKIIDKIEKSEYLEKDNKEDALIEMEAEKRRLQSLTLAIRVTRKYLENKTK